MAEIEIIKSPKHPGATFLKKGGTHDDFLCKIYKGHPELVGVIALAVSRYYREKNVQAHREGEKARP